jgi:hypothetical protein
MQINKVSLSDMFAWLIASFRFVGKHPGKLVLASVLSLIVLVALVIAMVVVLFMVFGAGQIAQIGQQPEMKTLLYIYSAMALFGVLLVPPFVAGWFKLCQNLETGRDSSATDIFTPYSSGPTWTKLIQYSLVSLLLYIAVHAAYILICMVLGISIQDFGTVLMPQPGSDPLAVTKLSAVFWLAYIGLILVGILMQYMLMLGFTQAALTESSAMDSLKAGIAGIIKNLPALIVFTLLILLVLIVIIFIAAMAIVLGVTLLKLINTAVAVAIGTAFYFGLILFIYPLMFSFQYKMWNSILGNENNADTVITKDTEFLV